MIIAPGFNQGKDSGYDETENPDLPTVAKRRWEGWHDYRIAVKGCIRPDIVL